jgi:hypothetical protein
MKIKASLAIAALLALPASPAFADHGENFHCSGLPFTEGPGKEAVDRLAHNNGMRQIIFFLASKWENEEIKRQCDAAANGATIDQSCLEGKRDWAAIEATIPEDLAGKSNKEIRPFMLEISNQKHHTTGRKEALSYCANLGVIDDVFK